MARRIELDDEAYPACLRELRDPPRTLHVEGTLPSLERAVAIVGTRRVDAAGLRFARELASDLARAGCTIVSGGAHGIDTAAHEGALDVGGATIAVLPSRLDEPYPPRNRLLFEHIAATGALLGEHELEPVRYASVFLARNRLIAALARITIVVQAPVQSGALSTAAHARKLGRPLMAVPFAPWEVRGAGCLELLAEGALMLRSSADVLAQIAPEQPPAPRRTRAVFGDEDQQVVHDALARGQLTVDALCD
ncbi:MAG: DNA-processing protein DprA, partial [Polyangiales bacterium]